MRVFLSYASEDKEQAELVALALTADGFQVFFDRASLPAGGDYNARIAAAVLRADIFVFLVSPQSLEPQSYALTELKLVREKWPSPQGRFLPVMIQPVAWEQVPPFLKSVTILQPEGNVAAEVLHAAKKLRAGSRRRVWIASSMLAMVASVAIVWTWFPQSPIPPYADSSAEEPSLYDSKSESDVLADLQRLNVKFSDADLARICLNAYGHQYRRLAAATIELLRDRKLPGVAFLDVIGVHYAQRFGKDEPGGLPANPVIDQSVLKQAIMLGYNENNMTKASSFEELVSR